ncbi:MAG: M20 family metallopeptidase [Chloroflexi bacterium]|nr:M20 family metallopeptidase [Chloroflexota bacterium]
MDDGSLGRKKTLVRDEVDQLLPELLTISHAIHANPETAFHEHSAAQLLTDFLERNGFSVQRGVADLPTAFRATFRGTVDGPTVAVVAEYDALPKLGHACGHNIIATASVGAAVALSRVAPDLPGTLVVLGTPGEEGGGGKIIMLERGAFQGVDAAMIVHPSVRNQTVSRSLATKHFKAEFFGKAAHASSAPNQGINALDALILSYNNLSALRQHLRADARIHGIITDGGEAPNIIPAHTAAQFIIRARDRGYLEHLTERVMQCFQAGAQATGARLEITFTEAGYAAMRPNVTIAEAFAANMRALGLKVRDPDPARGLGSTDMGNVSEVIPSIHPYIAIAPEGVVGHSPEFAEAARSEAGDLAVRNAAKALAATTLDLMSNPALLEKAKEEFRSQQTPAP